MPRVCEAAGTRAGAPCSHRLSRKPTLVSHRSVAVTSLSPAKSLPSRFIHLAEDWHYCRSVPPYLGLFFGGGGEGECRPRQIPFWAEAETMGFCLDSMWRHHWTAVLYPFIRVCMFTYVYKQTQLWRAGFNLCLCPVGFFVIISSVRSASKNRHCLSICYSSGSAPQSCNYTNCQKSSMNLFHVHVVLPPKAQTGTHSAQAWNWEPEPAWNFFYLCWIQSITDH